MRSSPLRLLGLVLCLGALPVTRCHASWNDGGVLVVHVQNTLVYSTSMRPPHPGGEPICGAGLPDRCIDAVARADGSEPVAFSILAAFPEGSFPRLAGVVFGIEYDPGIHITADRSCGDYDLPEEDWPDSGTGIAVSWAQAQETWVTQICAFIGYAEDAGPAELRTTPHPTQGGFFVDDTVIGDLVPIGFYPTLGFGMDGVFECPPPNVLGGCCPESGRCYITGRESCENVGGIYQGDHVGCDPNPCPRGACCFPDGTCTYSIPYDCTSVGGEFLGLDSDCVVNPCTLPGACCSPNGLCRIETEASCADLQWDYVGEGSACEPNPCMQPASGGCCFVDGTCEVLTAAVCAEHHGDYQGDGSSCEIPICPVPDRACCLGGGTCEFLWTERCLEMGGEPMAMGSICEPNPCEAPCPPFRLNGRPSTTLPSPPVDIWADAVVADRAHDGTGAMEGAEGADAAGPLVDDNPNRGGVLLVHVNEDLVYSQDGAFCGASDLGDCLDAVTRVDHTEPVVCHVLAAFGDNAAPRLTGLAFGIEYDDCVQVLDWHPCADNEGPIPGWPASGLGTELYWDEPRRAQLTEVYWFGLSSYDGRSGNFVLGPHPTRGGYLSTTRIRRIWIRSKTTEHSASSLRHARLSRAPSPRRRLLLWTRGMRDDDAVRMHRLGRRVFGRRLRLRADALQSGSRGSLLHAGREVHPSRRGPLSGHAR
ncbi:MAG: hypothetical protein R3E12_14700 [Candidatus Eisenbacteria bacterium]